MEDNLFTSPYVSSWGAAESRRAGMADEKSRYIGIRFAQNDSFTVTLDTSNYNVMDKWLFLL